MPPRTPLYRRRSVLGIAAAAPVAALGAVALTRTPAPEAAARPPAAPSVLRTRWSGRPDGPLPRAGDEGVPLQFFSTHGGAPSISGGALVGNLPPAPGATYVTQPWVSTIRRIGAEFGFEAGTRQGSLALVSFTADGSLTGHIHVAVSPDQWVASTLENGSLTEIGTADFAVPLVQDGRPYRTEVVVEGASLLVTLPDGSTVRCTGDDVARLQGVVACWEFFRERGDGAAVRMYETWAA